ncbi:UPF0235 protein [Allostella sp. ATCC 35155]|nr:UPF0235 protein [Stella sp. ATCC 35155]
MSTSPGDPPSPLTVVRDGVRIAIRLTPKAAADRLLGVALDEAGQAVLRAQVTAVPEAGRANAALVALLARTWRLPKSTIAVVQGQTARRKLVHIEGPPDALAARIREAMTRNE